MSDLFKLEELDQDGAIREAAEKVDPETRAAFLKKAGVGLGAVVAGSAFAGAVPGLASAGTPKSDVAILNFALTLEFLEAEFYTQAEKSKFGGKPGTFARVVGRHERAHVAFLRKALGKAAVAKPTFDFKGTTANVDQFVRTARVLEDTGVAAYLGQIANIKSKGVLRAAGSIATVEARHAAWIREILGGSATQLPAPTAFDAPKSKAQILAAVTGTGFITG